MRHVSGFDKGIVVCISFRCILAEEDAGAVFIIIFIVMHIGKKPFRRQTLLQQTAGPKAIPFHYHSAPLRFRKCHQRLPGAFFRCAQTVYLQAAGPLQDIRIPGKPGLALQQKDRTTAAVDVSLTEHLTDSGRFSAI